MRVPSDIFSRIKDIGRRRAAFGNAASSILTGWAMILVVGLLLIVAAAGYAAYRFYYWSDMESQLSQVEAEESLYDSTKVQEIWREYEERATRAELILKGMSLITPDIEIDQATD